MAQSESKKFAKDYAARIRAFYAPRLIEPKQHEEDYFLPIHPDTLEGYLEIAFSAGLVARVDGKEKGEKI